MKNIEKIAKEIIAVWITSIENLPKKGDRVTKVEQFEDQDVCDIYFGKKKITVHVNYSKKGV